jgi:hypothetical protein
LREKPLLFRNAKSGRSVWACRRYDLGLRENSRLRLTPPGTANVAVIEDARWAELTVGRKGVVTAAAALEWCFHEVAVSRVSVQNRRMLARRVERAIHLFRAPTTVGLIGGYSTVATSIRAPNVRRWHAAAESTDMPSDSDRVCVDIRDEQLTSRFARLYQPVGY